MATSFVGFLLWIATKWQFTHGVQRPELISPDNYWHVQYLLDREGNQEVQLELFLDYGTNVAEIPRNGRRCFANINHLRC